MGAPGPGDRLADRYRILEELGGGGMGVVFRARDENIGRDVAIKVLRLTNPDAARRFKREAQATLNLDPARVAQVFEVGETAAGEPFLVMELVPGRTVRAVLRDGQVGRPEALRLVREVATTLAAAHARGLVHRDVKPDNVMVRPDGRVVLLDFGIVKHIDLGGDAAAITTQLTSEGALLGTPAYLAPEQALGRAITPAVDQFSLAVTAFELLTGKNPWGATEATRMLAQILADAPLPASSLKPDLPQSFDAVLSRALAKTPDARFASVLAFADALESADRGTFVPSASVTLDSGSPELPADSPARASGPGQSPNAVTHPTTEPSRAKLSRSLRAPALLATLALLAGGALALRSRPPPPQPEKAGANPPLVLHVSPQAPLACPIFAVTGLPEIASRLGAAAASLACARSKWYLGGSDEKVLVPAALLDAPVQPRQDLSDFYEAGGMRDRTVDVAKARGLPFIDGTVSQDRDAWRIDLVVRAPDGREIARSAGVEATYFELAIRNAISQLWQTPPLMPAPLDPVVARWTGYRDTETGLLEADLEEVGAREEACASLRRRGAALGSAYSLLLAQCPETDAVDIDAGAVALDESSPSALVVSVNDMLNRPGPNPFSDSEMRRIALKLQSMRALETSRFGRASLARLAAILWSLGGDSERAHAEMLLAVGEDPLFTNDWYQLTYLARVTGASEATTSLAAVWFPQEPDFFRYVSTVESDALEARLRDDRLAYALEPTNVRTVALGRALAEAGRTEEVQALTTAKPVDGSEPDPNVVRLLLACIDLHDARFERALTRLDDAGAKGVRTLAIVAGVLGRITATATKWATAFVDQPDGAAESVAAANAGTIVMCMNARGALAGRCLTRVEKLAAERNSWGVGGDLFLRGAKRFALGDIRGAVNAWRPIVPSPNEELARLLPTPAFERAGEADLAARIDARKMKYREIAGISEATPREARRAFERGDRARARELARGVVQAWEVADAVPPAVGEMRALLAKVGD